MLLHHLQQADGGVEVVAIVEQGLVDALAHGLQSRKMDHAVDLFLGEQLVKRSLVAHVHFIEAESLARQLLYAAQRLVLAVDQVVSHHDSAARVQQFQAGMRTDEARAACDKDGLVHTFTSVALCIVQCQVYAFSPFSSACGSALVSASATLGSIQQKDNQISRV